MMKIKPELQKLWIKSRIERDQYLHEQQLAHRWSMIVIKSWVAFIVGFLLIKAI